MGAWGVKATQCDYGLDLLGGVITPSLQETSFKQFNVKELTAALKNHILDGIKRDNKGCSKADMEMYIDSNFPYLYDHAVMLMAECLVDFLNNGEIIIRFYKRGSNRATVKKISNVIYTADDLNTLLADLQSVLDPEREALYSTWEDSKEYDEGKNFEEWQSHIKSLLECLISHL